MRGFTLIEVLVVASITVMITGFLITNFSRSRIDLNQTAGTVQDAIREAQSLALSGALLKNTYRCGFGIHFNATGYTIYAGLDSATGCSPILGRNYQDEVTTPTWRSAVLSNSQLEIAAPTAGGLKDIFFEPPNPTTYIDNSNDPTTNEYIQVRVKGAACPATNSGPDCRVIYVSTSGLIQTK
jgi:prepilin-type N-terminal cleavage/methylation domain-containing protein